MNWIVIAVIIVFIIIIIATLVAVFLFKGTPPSNTSASGSSTQPASTLPPSTQPASTLPPSAPPPSSSPPSIPVPYDMTPGVDSYGNDIWQDATNAGNVDALKRSCDNATGCVAFNTGGWLKRSYAPREAWVATPGQDFYVRRGTSATPTAATSSGPAASQPPVIPPYTMTRGVDSYGYDIWQDAANAGNPDALKRSCENAQGCVAFNSGGWLKSAYVPQEYWVATPGQDFYVRSGSSSVKPRYYKFTPQLDSKGGDIAQFPELAGIPAAMGYRCDSIPGCVGFNSSGWLKKSILPSSQWYKWSNDGRIGLYTL
jgi:hypothetical protein